MKKIKFLLILSFILLIILLNIFLLQNMVLGVICGILYLSVYSYFLGKKLFKNQDKCFSLLLGFIFLLILIITCGTILYYTVGLFNWSISIILFVPLISIFLLHKKHACHPDESRDPAKNKYSSDPLDSVFQRNDKKRSPVCKHKNSCKKTKYLYFLDGIYFGLLASLFYILFAHQTTDSIVSPWQVVPSYFFIIYFLATSLLLYKIFIHTERFNLILITLHILLTSSVALIIYQIGYGFDPFIHRTTEDIILNNGFILPKNPYYIGQYSLIVILSKVFQVSVSLTDKILVPALSSIIIPTLVYFTLLKLNLEKKLSQIISLIFPFLILFTIYFTVPQHLANLFLIIFIFLILIYFKNPTKNRANNIIKLNHLWLLAIAITCIHPLAALPALMSVWLLSIRKNPVKLLRSHGASKILTILSILIFLISIPIIFYALSFILPNFDISLDLSNFKQKIISTFDFTYLPFNSFLHSLYFLKSIFPILILILIAIGFWQLKKQKYFYIFPLISLILLVNSYLLSLLKFNAVIYYEQNIFPERLIHFAYFFILPFVVYAIYNIMKIIIINKKNIFLAITAISFITTSFLYLSYPTYDILEKNKGYSVSQADILAVQKIQEISDTDNYIVLANQSTSVAALQEFGFKKYYNNNFYYPIPTSSPLYKIYLDISYNGIKPEFIEQAKNLTGANKVYLIFNDYWTNFKKLVPEGTSTAKNIYNINNKIYIFEY